MTASFKQLFDEFQAALKEAPDRAHAAFSTESRLVDGFHSRVKARQFTIDVDEPEALGGVDTAPTPVEYVLAALGSCQEITYRLYADALGIPLNSVSVKLEGDLDLRGFLDVDDSIRPGYQTIRGTVTIDSPASEEDLKRLREAVNKHCPVLDILQNPTPVSLELNRADAASAAAE